MVGKEFLDLFQKFRTSAYLSLEDFADRLNLFTVIIFLISCLFISTKQYVFNSISCYTPVEPSGGTFRDFVSDFCWVHGTIPFRPNEALPTTEAEWNLYDQHRRITYYQWVPFMLGLQCILFYLPHILWQTVCTSRAGGDIFTLIGAATKAAVDDRNTRITKVTSVAEFLEDMIEDHRTSRRGPRAQIVNNLYDYCGLCVVSKRMGTCLVISYLAIKLLIVVNSALQLYLIQCFLGFSGDRAQPAEKTGKETAPTYELRMYTPGYAFGWTILNYIRTGREWPHTLLFPRVAYCRVPGIRTVGGDNAYTAQCALPINMLNEKLYIFLWFWICFLLTITCGSLLLWLLRIASPFHRRRFVRRYLRAHKLQTPTESGPSSLLDEFVDTYLRRDGIFLVRMIAINAGHVVASEVVTVLWKNYLHRTEASMPPLPDLSDAKADTIIQLDHV
ncbi:unnamed protein product [Schistocephalus solidus]|uniref:Innexin n=1 Tax=Schistocephalus solidus TaxID=70667 RepID=A0A183SX00_SCHSO|nr:unnamed protein product [Schistocephalus solidus]